MNTLYKKLCAIFFVGLLALTLSPVGFAAGPVESAGIEKNGAAKKGDGVIRILAIGNSFSQDAVEQYLYELFDAAGIKVIIGNMYIGCLLYTSPSPRD